VSLILIANHETLNRHGRAQYRVQIYHNDRPMWDGTIVSRRTLKSLIGKIYRAIKKGTKNDR